MEKSGRGVLVVLLAAVLAVEVAVAQTVHVVGDSMGWRVPNSGGTAAYTTWASSKSFMVGDILTFNFPTKMHDVLRVTKESYDACTSTNPIGDFIVNGPANVTLSSSGDYFFICTIGRHCVGGQKLSISVIGGGGPSSAPSASPPPPPQAPGNGSTGEPVTSPPPPSPSSSAVLGSPFLMLFVFVVMNLVF